MQLLKIVFLKLTLKISVVLPAKLGLFRNSRKLQFRTYKLRPSQREIQQRGGTLLYKKGGKWGGVASHKVHQRKVRARGDEWLSCSGS